MPLDDDVVRGRPPKLGTVTTGTTVPTKSGEEMRPDARDVFVFHCNDEEVAEAVQVAYGGDITSPEGASYGFDVVTEATSLEVQALPHMFRQWFELWRTAECVRRCTGTEMVTVDGRGVDNEPCICDPDDRECSPSTVMPCLIDLPDLPRLAMWEIRSTSYGTAGNLKGTIGLIGSLTDEVPLRVPMVVSLSDRQVRDREDKVQTVTEMSATVLASPDGHIAQPALSAPAPAGLMDGDDRARGVLLERWETVVEEARALSDEVYARIREDWRGFRETADDEPADLPTEALARWVQLAESTVEDARAAFDRQPAEE